MNLRPFRKLKNCFVVSCLLLIFLTRFASAQHESIDFNRIERLVTMAFPKMTSNFGGQQLDYAFDILMRPSFEAPVQISVFRRYDGSLEGYIVTTTIQTKSIEQQIDEIYERNVNASDKEILLALNMTKRPVKFPKRLSPYLNEFFAGFRIKPTSTVTLDGTRFYIGYKDSSQSISYEVGDVDIPTNGRSVSVWAKRIISRALM